MSENWPSRKRVAR